jgi:hypothetical protein
MDNFLFKSPVVEGVHYHDAIPEDRWWEDNTNPIHYAPIQLLYHPYTTLEFVRLGQYGPVPETGDLFAYSHIDIGRFILAYRAYHKQELAADRTPSYRRFVSGVILIPLFTQFANISLINRYFRLLLDIPMDEEKRETALPPFFVNATLLHRRMMEEHKTNPFNKFIHLFNNIPDLSNIYPLDQMLVPRGLQVNANNTPFIYLSTLSMTEMLLELMPDRVRKRERSVLRKISIQIKRTLRASLIEDYVKDKGIRSEFNNRLNNIRSIL